MSQDGETGTNSGYATHYQGGVEPRAGLSPCPVGSSEGIGGIPADNAKTASEISPDYKNWRPTRNYDEEANNNVIVKEDWKEGEIEYGRWTSQFDDAENDGNTALHRAPTEVEHGRWATALYKAQAYERSVVTRIGEITT